MMHCLRLNQWLPTIYPMTRYKQRLVSFVYELLAAPPKRHFNSKLLRQFDLHNYFNPKEQKLSIIS